MRKLSIGIMGLGLLLAWTGPSWAAGCEVHSAAETFADRAFLGVPLCDTAGNQKVNVGAAGTATAAAPTYTEGGQGSFSFNLSGEVRVNPGVFIGADEANNLVMTSGGIVRQTQLVGTGGVPTTATNATTSAQILPTLKKTFHGIVTCTGTCVQTQKIYGAYESSATVAKSVLVCTLTMNASTTAVDYCVTDVNFSYWFVVTSATSGTTPLAALLVQY